MKDGIELLVCIWLFMFDIGELCGIVIFVYGMVEYSGCYLYVVKVFIDFGLCVWVFDLCGYGKSGGLCMVFDV